MKNTILGSVLLALITTQAHADITQPVKPPATQEPPVTAPATNAINCDYKIPPETKKIDQSLVINWAEKAVTQAFNFDPANVDTQVQKLQPCFTEQGWTGFNTALQKSGNLEAIKSQKLTVSSQVDGQVIVKESKDNQWKLNVPLQVTYQNEKQKVTQALSIDLTVGRKITGDLGITQMIAAPRGTTEPEKTITPNNVTQPTSSNIQDPVANPVPAEPATPTTPTEPTQPTSPDNRATQPTPTPSTPGQPTIPGNRSNQPSLPPK